jgi:hypothetical protein
MVCGFNVVYDYKLIVVYIVTDFFFIHAATRTVSKYVPSRY